MHYLALAFDLNRNKTSYYEMNNSRFEPIVLKNSMEIYERNVGVYFQERSVYFGESTIATLSLAERAA